MADLALFILTLLWGTTFTLVKQVLAANSAGVFLFLRFSLAVTAAGAIWIWRRDKPTPALWRHGFLLGLTMLATFLAQTEGLRFTTAAHSGFVTGLYVLIVPFLARFIMKRAVPVSTWIGVALAFSGLLLLTRPWADDVPSLVLVGDALTFISAIACAFQIIFTSEWSPRHKLAPFVFLQLAVTWFGSGLLAIVEPLRLAPSPALWSVLAYTGILLTTGAFFVQNWAQRHVTAVRATLIYSLEPVSAALFAHYYGGEPMTRLDWLGGALIVAGVITAEYVALRRLSGLEVDNVGAVR